MIDTGLSPKSVTKRSPTLANVMTARMGWRHLRDRMEKKELAANWRHF